VQGGYSGPGVKPVALRCAWECARAVAIPVIGCGGIARAHGRARVPRRGLRAVQVGTAAFSDPRCPDGSRARCGTLLEEDGVRARTTRRDAHDGGRAATGEGGGGLAG
jgi:dihydroorotate dehydrogenase (NAD+) catalytic subunit